MAGRRGKVGAGYYWLLLGILGVWRAARLLYAEDGPWNIFAGLRKWAGEGFWGGLLDCFYCLSLWVALPFAYVIGETWKERGLLWLALSGAAILVERIMERAAPSSERRPAPVVYFEDQEGEHVLRKEQNANEGGDNAHDGSAQDDRREERLARSH
jgi:hypothetical protein